jgi:hypothetical protein
MSGQSKDLSAYYDTLYGFGEYCDRIHIRDEPQTIGAGLELVSFECVIQSMSIRCAREIVPPSKRRRGLLVA